MNNASMSPIDYDDIRNKLRLLQRSAEARNVFGALSHGYQMHLPLTEEEIGRFETVHGVRLPADYRGFLIHVGNGGAGVAYGVFKLGEMDDNWGVQKWQENDGFVGTLSKPFPHTERWNDLSGYPEYDDEQAVEKGYEDKYEELLNKFDERYWGGEQVHGAIPICHRGCALRNWLVITGSETGHIWCDDRADLNGLYPLQEYGVGRVTFMQWYNAWLERALVQVRK
jgi:hypothetical protein